MKPYFRSARLSLLLLSLFALAGTANAQQPKTLLWKVSGNGLAKPSFLFGTYHLMDSSFTVQHPKIMESFGQCKRVVGEMDLGQMNPGALMQHAMMKNDTTLKSLLSPADYQKVAAAFKDATGADLDGFGSFRPALISQQMNLAIVSKTLGRSVAGMDGSLDGYLQVKARQRGMGVAGLETIDDQIQALFYATSVKRQAEKLVESAGEVKKIKKQAKKLDACYMEQNLDCLYGLLQEGDLDDAEVNALLTKRNNAWVERLKTMMKEEPCFIAVGALHLPGPGGLIELLRRAGYKVEPVMN